LERARITVGLHVPRITEAKCGCRDLETAIEALEKAANEGPTTIEAMATLRIDLGLMKSGLATTQKTIQVAQIQLDQARTSLGLS
jgi:hypothetical protein